MNWIWESYVPDRKYVINERFDPYCETLTFDGDTVFVNVLQRFEAIFGGRIRPSEEGYDGIYHTAVHYLAQHDLMSGIAYEDIIYDLLGREIMEGAYGQEVRELFASDCVTETERRRILYWLYRSRKENNCYDVFSQVFIELFQEDPEESARKQIPDFFDTLLILKYGDPEKAEELANKKLSEASCFLGYQEPYPEIYYRKSTETLYYYCGKRTKRNQPEKFRLIKLLFADASDRIEDIWGACFGVLGEDDRSSSSCPILDEFQLL